MNSFNWNISEIVRLDFNIKPVSSSSKADIQNKINQKIKPIGSLGSVDVSPIR
jgi:hypothetical protein